MVFVSSLSNSVSEHFYDNQAFYKAANQRRVNMSKTMNPHIKLSDTDTHTHTVSGILHLNLRAGSVYVQNRELNFRLQTDKRAKF